MRLFCVSNCGPKYGGYYNYQGYVQSDAYAGYNILFGEDSNRINVGCWAHVRRKYMDVIKALGKHAPKGVAHEIIELIAKLYAIESRAVKDGLTHQQLKEQRQLKYLKLKNLKILYINQKQCQIFL